MAKKHFKVIGVDCRNQGQTEFEYSHQAACGYVRKEVTTDGDQVDCFYCLRSEGMKHYHQINAALTDSQGCY
ncbi:hypothetical protein [Neptunomonas japonica]|uniref:hypothetical protein n=1 Tax=Neptunomonas japonica TaxID=417574 RepID=UPI0003F95C22|nr:hypothetical protein [Neptunomonas japonica]